MSLNPKSPPGGRAIHHLDLWVGDYDAAGSAWGWLLSELGWSVDFTGDSGRAWLHPDGTYLFMQAALDERDYERRAAGVNHLAFVVPDLARLNDIRSACTQHGWSELFAATYPHAGGSEHTALYLEDEQGLEVEIVAES